MFGWGPTRTSVALSLTIVLASLGLAPAAAGSTTLVPDPLARRPAGETVSAAEAMTDAKPQEVVRLTATATGADPTPAPDLDPSFDLAPVPADLRPGLRILLAGLLEASATLPADADDRGATVPEATGAAVRVLEAIDEARPLLTGAAEGSESFPDATLVECASGDVIVELPRPLREGCSLVVGGPGPTTYEADALVSVDLGGADRYENNAGGTRLIESVPLVRSPALQPPQLGFAWDLGSANDTYVADGDTYGPVQGASDAYLGVLVDDGGADTYRIPESAGYNVTHGQGSSTGSLGLLVDLGRGDDRYETAIDGQGGTLVGLGLLLDRGGADAYVATNGFTQGASGGGSAFFPGGVGALVDQRAGADTYRADGNKTQGASAYGGTGLLVDGGGNDTYEAGRIAQGASLHAEAGFLFDAGGDDVYRASAKCQGYGESGGVGVLVDGGGMDAYECPSPSFPDRRDGTQWHHFTGGPLPGVGVGLDTGMTTT